MKVDCLERIKLSKDEYERLRSNPIHFAVVRGHERLEIERVVAENDGYLVVEKLPGAREIALAADPRS